jgi:hypothetical protein
MDPTSFLQVKLNNRSFSKADRRWSIDWWEQ